MSIHQNVVSMFANVTSSYLSNKSKLIELIKISGLAKSIDKNYNSALGLQLNVNVEKYADYLIGVSKANIESYVEYNTYAGNFIFTWLYLSKFKTLRSATLVSNQRVDLSWLSKNIIVSNDYGSLRASDLTYIDIRAVNTQKIYDTNDAKLFVLNDVNGLQVVDSKPVVKVVEKIEKQKTPEFGIPGLVSIVIPCYNSCKYIADTLQSIKKQTYNYYEIIVVDDGSKSTELIKLKLAIEKFDNIKLFENCNHGACHARNFGASHANGEFLLFCDSDVKLDANYLSKTIQTLHNNPACSWAYCNFSIGNKKLKFHKFNANILKKHNFCSTMSLLRAKHFVGFNETLKRLQDWEMFYRMSLYGNTGIWIDEDLFYAADRPGITNNSVKWNVATTALKHLHPEMDC